MILDNEYCIINDYSQLEKIISEVEETFTWGKDRNYEKGSRFEKFTKFLLNSLNVCDNIHNIKTTSNQIDYRVQLKPHRFYHPFLLWIGQNFIVECKNENSSISTREVSDLINLLKSYACIFGVFLARNDISSIGKFADANANRYKEYFSDSKRVIIAITFDDIKELCKLKGNFLTLLRTKYNNFVDEKDLTS